MIVRLSQKSNISLIYLIDETTVAFWQTVRCIWCIIFWNNTNKTVKNDKRIKCICINNSQLTTTGQFEVLHYCLYEIFKLSDRESQATYGMFTFILRIYLFFLLYILTSRPVIPGHRTRYPWELSTTSHFFMALFSFIVFKISSKNSS